MFSISRLLIDSIAWVHSFSCKKVYFVVGDLFFIPQMSDTDRVQNFFEKWMDFSKFHTHNLLKTNAVKMVSHCA